MKATSRVARLSLIAMLAALWACNGATGGFGSNGSTGDREEDSGEEEDETGDVPQEVTGGFLTCAFMDSRNAVMAKIERSTEGTVDIACGIFRPEGGAVKIAAISHLTMRTRILTSDDTYQTLEHNRLRAGSDLHVVTGVPIKYLAGTLQVDVKSANGRWVAFRKSIPTIQSFDARTGFNIESDMDQQGISLAGDGSATIVTSSQGSGSGFDWFRDIVAPVLVGAFGADYGEPESTDNGTEPMTSVGNTSSSSYDGYNDDPTQYRPYKKRWPSKGQSDTGSSAQGPAQPSAPAPAPAPTTGDGTGTQQPATEPAPAPANPPAPTSPAPGSAPAPPP